MKKIIITILLLVILALAVWLGWLVLKRNNNINTEINPTPTDNVEPIIEEEITSEEVVPDPFEHDKDHDGISDEDEIKYGTSDYEFDTDKDSLSDKSEIERFGTDPTKKDTDGDGFGDAIELINGYNPLGEGKLVK